MKSTDRAAALRMTRAAVESLSCSPLRRVRYLVLATEDDAGVATLEDWDDGFLHTATMGVEFACGDDTAFFTWCTFSWTHDPGDYALLAERYVASDGTGWVDASEHPWWSALIGETPLVTHCWYGDDPRRPTSLWPTALRLSVGDVVTWVILGRAAITDLGETTGKAWLGGDEVFVVSDGQLDSLGLTAMRSYAVAPASSIDG